MRGWYFEVWKNPGFKHEKLAAVSVQTLLKEKSTLINELETFRIDEEKSYKAMESLASTLHEASSEAREAKQKVISTEEEHENLET